jgi:fatty-acyl-CoA synthase
MTGWNFADIWEMVAETIPDSVAQVQGERVMSWRQFNERANRVAATLLAAGAGQGDKVAQYLYNGPEYLESVFGCLKAGLVPVNTNYRYTDDELVYLWDNADAVAVVFHGTFAPVIERVRGRCATVRTWLWVDDGSGACPSWAQAYEQGGSPSTNVSGPWGRSGRDLFFVYTGGTTGMPKGTMWEQDTLAHLLLDTPLAPMPADLEELRSRVSAGGGLCTLAVAPLMHGTGALVTISQLARGGRVVFTRDRALDTAEVSRLIGRHGVNVLVLIGDVMAKPLVEEWEAHEGDGTYQLGSLIGVVSSGVMWSTEVKARMLAQHPAMLLLDTLGSSEAIGMGLSMATGTGAGRTASFTLGDHAVVMAEDGSLVEPGSGAIGRIAVRGLTPIGYYKDPEKSAATFPVIDGVRYTFPGDWATIEADGSLTLLGRGSVVINSGGEKVFPEEVEEVLKTHPGVRDAVAVGVPDERFGEVVAAVVEVEDGQALDEAALIAHVKGHLAPFKAPKRVVTIPSIGRAPNAKVDYKRLKSYAREQLGR